MKKLLHAVLNKETVTYVFFGGLTTLVNLVVFKVFDLFFGGKWYLLTNTIAWIAAVAFAFVTNKLFVFRSRCPSRKELILEIGRFIISRGATGLVDYFGLIIAIDVLGLNRVWSKYAVQIVVIILNYLLGKRVVFLNAKSSSSKKQDQRRDIC